MKYLLKLTGIMVILVSIGFLTACGDDDNEDVTPTDDDGVIIDDGDDDGTIVLESEADALMDAAYVRWRDAMYNHQNNAHGVQVWPGDLMVLPQRGSDWEDAGRHQQLHLHSYDNTNETIIEAWDDHYEAMGASLIALNAYEAVEDVTEEKLGAAKAAVAFNMYNLFDLFAQVPYDRLNDGSVTILSGEDAINEIEALLLEALDLMDEANAVPANSLQFTKAAVWATLAKLYLNKGVFLNRYGTPTFDAADMDKVYEYTSLIIDNGGYALESDYFRMFDAENASNSEFILAVEQLTTEDRDFGRAELAFNQIAKNQHYIVNGDGRGSNGGAITESFFNMWDQTDPRFFEKHIPTEATTIAETDYIEFNRGILYGQQFGPLLNDDGSDFQTDGEGNILIEALETDSDPALDMNFTTTIDNIVLTTDQINQGARVSKYQADPGGTRKIAGFDIPLIRLADIYLMRAEATHRGASSGDALADLNAVRTARAGDADSGTETLAALGEISDEILLNERAFELYWEPHRRSDLIRFGAFEGAWSLNDGGASENYRVFPIPATPLSTFSSLGLEQNQGY